MSRPELLVFTVEWQGEDADGVISTVTVEFHQRGAETAVVLTQTGLLTVASRDGHEDGWTKCLANLDARVFAPRAGRPTRKERR